MKHKRIFVIAILLGMVGVLSACSGNTEPVPAAQVQELDTSGNTASAPAGQVQELDTSYANALDTRTQLLLGIVRLEEGTGPTLSKEQAAALLPLWQMYRSLIASGTASQAEVDAVTSQILAFMTTEQIQAIIAMHLTQADMQAFNQSLGVSVPGVPPSGVVPGQGQQLSPEERATRQAQFGGTGNSTASIDYLIQILEGRSK